MAKAKTSNNNGGTPRTYEPTIANGKRLPPRKRAIRIIALANYTGDTGDQTDVISSLNYDRALNATSVTSDVGVFGGIINIPYETPLPTVADPFFSPYQRVYIFTP